MSYVFLFTSTLQPCTKDYLFKAPEVKVPLPIEDVKKRGLKFV